MPIAVLIDCWNLFVWILIQSDFIAATLYFSIVSSGSHRRLDFLSVPWRRCSCSTANLKFTKNAGSPIRLPSCKSIFVFNFKSYRGAKATADGRIPDILVSAVINEKTGSLVIELSIMRLLYRRQQVDNVEQYAYWTVEDHSIVVLGSIHDD